MDYKELVMIKMGETIGAQQQLPTPEADGRDLEREDLDEEERNAEEWRDVYPDYDDDNDRLPSERFYHPNN